MAQDIILETRGLTKGFRGFIAVSDINLHVQRGSIHAFIGPNGIDKTTCFNLLTRFLVPMRGTILFNGVDITSEKPVQIAYRGIIRSFQISAVFPHLMVMENVRAGLRWQLGTAYTFRRNGQSLNMLNMRAMGLLEQAGLTKSAHTVMVELPYDRKRALEIATALVMEPELMLFDEPTQGTGHEDVGHMTELIRRAAQDRTVLMVEHNMNVVSSIADKITVLQRGQILAEGPYEDIPKNLQVVEAYMSTTDAALEGH